MAIRFYDEAVTKKIGDWIKDKNVKVLSPQDSTRLFTMLADEKNDKPFELPIIAISRDPSLELLTTAKRPMTFSGHTLGSSSAGTLKLTAIPMSINYQLDIYTRYFAEADEYFRNFVFNLVNYPKVTITLPYNDTKIQCDATIIVDGNVADNSDIPERIIAGQFTRLTIKFKIDDAYLFSVPFNENWKIEYNGIAIEEE